MLEFEMYSDDPRNPIYYYSLLLTLVIFATILKIVSNILNNNGEKNSDLHCNLLDNKVNNDKDLVKKKNSLRFRYLVCYVITKGNIWSKSPYLWALYHIYHKFSINEIGILYLIDNFSAFIFGPITGNLADKFGRKFFCMSYCFLVICNLSMRLTGDRYLAYFAQVLTGISAALINTTFESWVNYEASKEFGSKLFEKEIFLKKLFKTQAMFDALVSVAASMLAAIFYNIYGIFAPIIISIILASIAMITIYFLWDENRPGKDSKYI